MNDDNNFMNGVAIGVGFGVLGGIASTLWYRKKKTMSPDAVLDGVKAAFLAEGPIEGSYISFEKQPVRKFAVRSEGYVGGITRFEDSELIRYEFLADAYTGTVLEINRVK